MGSLQLRFLLVRRPHPALTHRCRRPQPDDVAAEAEALLLRAVALDPRSPEPHQVRAPAVPRASSPRRSRPPRSHRSPPRH